MNQVTMMDEKVVPMPFGQLEIRDYFTVGDDDIAYQKMPPWSPVEFNAIRLDTSEATNIEDNIPVVRLHSKLILSKHAIPETN